MKKIKKLKLKIERRKIRIHKKMREIALLTKRPRLVVARSNRYIYGQIIDDKEGKTLASISSRELKDEKVKKSKTEIAKIAGKMLAEKALKLGIKNVVFDKGKYKYHGRVKALAEGAREGGLMF